MAIVGIVIHSIFTFMMVLCFISDAKLTRFWWIILALFGATNFLDSLAKLLAT